MAIATHVYEVFKIFGGVKDPVIQIKVNDGSVNLWPCSSDMGQGTNPKTVQVVSGLLKVPMKNVKVQDYDSSMHGGTSVGAGSAGTEMVVEAIRRGCNKLNEKLALCYDSSYNLYERDASGNLTTDLLLDASGNTYNLLDDLLLDITRSWDKLLRYNFAFGGTGGLDPFFGGFVADDLSVQMTEGVGYNPMVIHVKYASISEVEVNMLTGKVQLLETDIMYDMGSALNPAIDMGQLEGGFLYALGSVLHEERLYDNDSNLLVNDTWEYKPASIVDLPNKFVASFLANEDPDLPPSDSQYVPFGAKPSQEMGTELASSAYAAIKDAIRAFRFDREINPEFQLNTPAVVNRVTEASGLTTSDVANAFNW